MFNKKNLQLFAWAMVAIALVCSLAIGIQRMAAESEYKQVDISVNYADVVAMANGNDYSTEEFVEILKEHGVSSILFKETSLGDLNRQGKISMEMGRNLVQASFYPQISQEVPINDATLYIGILEDSLIQQVVAHLQAKVIGVQYYQGEVPVIAVPVMVPSSDSEQNNVIYTMGEIGIGFEQAAMEEMASYGMGIIPQVRSWQDVSDESLRMVAKEIKAIANLEYILFNDKELPGDTEDMRSLATLLTVDGEAVAPVGTIEFSEQKGLTQLGVLLDKDVIRLHTIANNEMSKYTVDEALDRWMLAVNERNMRGLLVRFFDINRPSTSLEENLEYLSALKTSLEGAGYQLEGAYQKPNSIQVDNKVLYIVGMGVAAGVMLILLNMNLLRLSTVAFVVVTVAWIGLFSLSPILARKLMALASVMVFPTLSCLMIMTPQRRSLGKSILALLSMCAISLMGAVLMVALLADVLFMLKLDQFVGVKIAHIIPIAIVPFVLYICKEANPVKALQVLFEKTVTYKWALLAVVVGIAGVIYISRTGNTTAELSSAESFMRNYLNDIMGVRPRTKEFLIGYPFAILLLYYGASKKNWILTIPAVVGQVSLVNTYAHIHTQLSVSMMRSVNGLILGLIIGLLLWVGVKTLEKIWTKLQKIS